ncbi:MAG TPA: tetratricopeptide repeat protein [Nitrospirae bacterium]|nr:tetratricopeptide repeat protein [Nitrospirota bacterium]
MIKNLIHKPLFHFLIIALFSLIAYSNTFNVPFHFDDKKVIVENSIIKDLGYFTSPSKAKEFKEHYGYHTFKSRYVGYLTFALNYKVHGLDVTGYHIVNLLIHITTALLLYQLVILCFMTPFLARSNIKKYSGQIAFFSALLFACHPIQTEAVTYLWQRVASLTAMFYLLSLILYIKWRLSPDQGRGPLSSARSFPFYLLSIITVIIAMKTKQTAFTLPAAIAMYEFIFFDGKVKKRLLYLIPFALTMLIIPLTLIDIGKPLGNLTEATRVLTDISRTDYLLTQFRVLVTYIRLIFLPINQNLDYDYPIYTSFLSIGVFTSFIFLAALFSSGVYLFYRYRDSVPHTRLITFGILWFFITLSTESSIIPISNLICEYRMYLPSAGVFILLVTGIFMFVQRYESRHKTIGTAAVCILVVIAVVLTGTTYARNTVWNSELSLWSDVIKKSPGKARGYNNVGMCYYESKDRAKAIPYFQKAIEIDPLDYKALNNLGLSYMGEGRPDKAIESLSRAVKIKPSNGMYHINLGIAFLQKRDTNKGIMEINIGKALRREQRK